MLLFGIGDPTGVVKRVHGGNAEPHEVALYPTCDGRSRFRVRTPSFRNRVRHRRRKPALLVSIDSITCRPLSSMGHLCGIGKVAPELALVCPPNWMNPAAVPGGVA